MRAESWDAGRQTLEASASSVRLLNISDVIAYKYVVITDGQNRENPVRKERMEWAGGVYDPGKPPGSGSKP